MTVYIFRGLVAQRNNVDMVQFTCEMLVPASAFSPERTPLTFVGVASSNITASATMEEEVASET